MLSPLRGRRRSLVDEKMSGDAQKQIRLELLGGEKQLRASPRRARYADLHPGNGYRPRNRSPERALVDKRGRPISNAARLGEQVLSV